MTRYEATLEAINKLKECVKNLEDFLSTMSVEEAQEVLNERCNDD